MEGPEKRILPASAPNQDFKSRTVNPDSTEAEVTLPAGKKASGKSAKVVRTSQEPLNPNATTIPVTPSPTLVAQETVRQVATGDHEAPTDHGYSGTNPGHVEQGEMAGEVQADRVRCEKQARKEKKAEDRRTRDAALAASLAQTRDIGTPRNAGPRSSVQTT